MSEDLFDFAGVLEFNGKSAGPNGLCDRGFFHKKILEEIGKAVGIQLVFTNKEAGSIG